MSDSFLQADAWTGGNVDALLYFGRNNTAKAVQVFDALWSFPRLFGPYPDRHRSPADQAVITTPDYTDDGLAQYVGVYTHHDGAQSNFVHTAINDDDGLWVYAGVTVGSLPDAWDVGPYPIDDGRPCNWLKPLLDDLQSLTDHINQSCPIYAATYGWLTVADCDILLQSVAGDIPSERWAGIDIWRGGVRQSYPPTHYEPPMRVDA